MIVKLMNDCSLINLSLASNSTTKNLTSNFGFMFNNQLAPHHQHRNVSQPDELDAGHLRLPKPHMDVKGRSLASQRELVHRLAPASSALVLDENPSACLPSWQCQLFTTTSFDYLND